MRRLPAILLLAVPAAALASGGGEAAGHAPGIPWGEIVKQAINFAILAFVLVFFLRKPITSFLKERSELLKKSIDEAAKARAEAQEKLAAIEARLSGLSREAADMGRQMESEAAEEARKLREAAEAEISRLREQARFLAEQEVRKARGELRREAAELSSRAAEDLVKKAMTPEDQERMVRENIDKIREIVK